MTDYLKIVRQIEELKSQADKARKDEIRGVIKSIRQSMSLYGITVSDLGLASDARSDGLRVKPSNDAKAKRIHRKKSAAVSKVAPKYRDDLGNTWSGRGKQPKWIVTALASGKSLESMLIR